MTPVICLIFTYLIKKLASDNIPTGSLFDDNPYPYVFGDYALLDKYSKMLDPNGLPTNISSRDNPLQWYLFSCGGGCNATLLGANNGFNPVSVPDGKSLWGSIVNSGSSVDNFTLDYYSQPYTWENRFFPFFLSSNATSINEDLFNRIAIIEK